MIAKVIVDVPAKQTNRAFDYIVPLEMQQWVEVGSRVGVPFGPRVLQGFVVELQEVSSVALNRLKPIQHVLDLVPPLTGELVKLAGWMSRAYLCHEVIALQVMLPGALKAKYERGIAVGSASQVSNMLTFPVQSDIVEFVRSKETVAMEAIMDKFPQESYLIKELLAQGVLIEVQRIKDRLSAKKVLTVFPPDDVESLTVAAEQLPARSHKQKEVLLFLRDNPHPVRLTELMESVQVGASTVKGLADRGFISLEETEVLRDPYAGRTFARTSPLPLTEEQAQVFGEIQGAINELRTDVFLLHGVTGSGKTEVYLQSIQECLNQGREAIVLVPEISLTPQMVERFKGRFGNLVAVLHSRLSQGERYDEWRKIAQKQVKVVIGARSAVFAPFTKLGLIIIDEEHESSYKQEDSPKYHAREIAVQRAIHNGATVILGSATPSLESMHRTDPASKATPPYKLLSMKARVAGRPMPPVHIIDMREELKNGNRSMFSGSLYKAIEERLHKKEQTVLLLNRRGYATFVMCRTCGFVCTCPHCEVSLTYHQSSRMLRCHYCGYAEREVLLCPGCGSEHIRHFGTGTQRVEEELSKLFPGIRVIRMDVDTTTEKGSHEKWLTMFSNKQADLLLGTQMVAKGLDFPDVTLVGVIAADTVLNLPDFRSAERTFQLLTQVAGRAGRHQKPGEVFVQTYTPEHYSIQCASRHDYISFVSQELELRGKLGYPPFHRLILITFSHEQVPLLVRTAEAFVTRLKELIGEAESRAHREMDLFAEENGHSAFYMEVLGPVASPISRIKDRYRFQCMVKYRGELHASELVAKAVAMFEELTAKEKLQISVDVDPQYLM
jgi:primosomal protein N' (replication factor Y)